MTVPTALGPNRDAWLWNKRRARALQQWGPNPRCAECGDTITGTVYVGHILARVHGGTDEPGNLQPECAACSASGGGRIGSARVKELIAAGREKTKPVFS